MTWHRETERRLVERARALDPVTELWVLGSGREPATMDRWSDLDLGLVLSGRLDLGDLLAPDDVVWALDRSAAGPRATCRTVLADGRRLDLVVSDGDDLRQSGGVRRYVDPDPSIPRAGAQLTATPATDDAANEARFVAALAVVKHGRGDLLIGTHLCLELAQLVLVQAMLLRDRDEGTRWHRFGSGRDGEAADVVTVLTDSADTALTVRRLADLFDRLHGELVPDYVSDWSGMDALLGPD